MHLGSPHLCLFVRDLREVDEDVTHPNLTPQPPLWWGLLHSRSVGAILRVDMNRTFFLRAPCTAHSKRQQALQFSTHNTAALQRDWHHGVTFHDAMRWHREAWKRVSLPCAPNEASHAVLHHTRLRSAQAKRLPLGRFSGTSKRVSVPVARRSDPL
eukprot:SAG11_NODE_126_length_15729_cov_9.966859_7_plen_156_part_00